MTQSLVIFNSWRLTIPQNRSIVPMCHMSRPDTFSELRLPKGSQTRKMWPQLKDLDLSLEEPFCDTSLLWRAAHDSQRQGHCQNVTTHASARPLRLASLITPFLLPFMHRCPNESTDPLRPEERHRQHQEGKRKFLPRITHTAPRCATLANCVRRFL